MKVKIKRLRPSAQIPKYAHPGDAGMDVCNAGETVILKPSGRALIPTGLSVEVPSGHELQVRPRSGLALKKGITVLNTPGTIDSGYRGEVGVILFNTNPDAEVAIETGERIAQLVLARFETIDWEAAEELEKSSRAEGGFGSTGTH